MALLPFPMLPSPLSRALHDSCGQWKLLSSSRSSHTGPKTFVVARRIKAIAKATWISHSNSYGSLHSLAQNPCRFSSTPSRRLARRDRRFKPCAPPPTRFSRPFPRFGRGACQLGRRAPLFCPTFCPFLWGEFAPLFGQNSRHSCSRKIPAKPPQACPSHCPTLTRTP